jgi:hypothetical protein
VNVNIFFSYKSLFCNVGENPRGKVFSSFDHINLYYSNAVPQTALQRTSSKKRKGEGTL